MATGLESYQGTGGYLQSAQDHMGYGTVMPGQMDPVGGYGVYIGDEAYARQATDRIRRNVAESRAAMLEAEAYDKQMYDYAEARRQRPMKEQQANWAHEEKQMLMENARARFRAENPALWDAVEAAQYRVDANKERRNKYEAQMQTPIIAMITELYENGEVSPEAIAEYNESIKDNPNRAPIKEFGKDPETGELYSVTEDGQRYPFQSLLALDAWRDYYPEREEWALSSYPIQVRKEKIAEAERKRIQAKDDLANAKMAAGYAEKERKAQVDLHKSVMDDLREDIKNAEKNLSDGVYQTEEERLALEKEIQALKRDYKTMSTQMRALLGLESGGAQGAPGTRVTEAAQDVQASGVSAGGEAVRDWKDANKPQQQ